jgi:hypothetical protein
MQQDAEIKYSALKMVAVYSSETFVPTYDVL